MAEAYLQSMPSKRLIFYNPSKEFYDRHPEMQEYVWKSVTQIYGDVEAGEYWFHTFVPCLKDNIMDYKQAQSDPSFLYSPAYPAAITLGTDDCLTAIPTSHRSEEEKKALRFPSRIAQEPPTDF